MKFDRVQQPPKGGSKKVKCCRGNDAKIQLIVSPIKNCNNFAGTKRNAPAAARKWATPVVDIKTGSA